MKNRKKYFLSFWFSKNSGVVFINLQSGITSHKGCSLLAVSFIIGKWHVGFFYNHLCILKTKVNPPKNTTPKTKTPNCQYPRKGWVAKIFAQNNTYTYIYIYICPQEVLFSCSIMKDRKKYKRCCSADRYSKITHSSRQIL